MIVADDGEFLGLITTNSFASNSLMNEFGPHGSEFASNSIFNDFGRYGSEFSSLSPFNDYTSTPPKILCDPEGAVAYLTSNRALSPGVDPHLLIGLLKAAR